MISESPGAGALLGPGGGVPALAGMRTPWFRVAAPYRGGDMAVSLDCIGRVDGSGWWP
jgi:hypothetical protein